MKIIFLFMTGTIIYQYFPDEQNCGFKLGHYFFFLTFVYKDLFIWIHWTFAIIAKLNESGSECDKGYKQYFPWLDNLKDNVMLIPAILLSWLSIKYQYYLPLEVLIFTFVILLRSGAYFYSLLWAGEL